jgi:Pyruvate/2-oxoacid:ferredoxin oxidoreductase delta subunit
MNRQKPSVFIYFFSGTGNSWKLALWSAAAFEKNGWEAQICSIKRPIRQSNLDLLVICSPTHGFIACWEILKWLMGLARGEGRKAVVLMSRGALKIGKIYIPGLEGTGLYLQLLVLWLKGYHVIGARAFDMPSNWILVHPPLKADAILKIEKKAQAEIAAFWNRLLPGQKIFGGKIRLLLGLLLAPVSLAYLFFGRFMLGKVYFYSNACTSCGLCASRCPFGALKMRQTGDKKKPYWTFACSNCMRCINLCPEKAIETGHLWMVMMVFAASYDFLEGILAYVSGGALPSLFRFQPMAFLLHWANFVFLVWLSYALFWRILRLKRANHIFKWGSFTRLYGRYNPEISKSLPQ